jgi:predicted TIM-barrel fold metal-dependent hydrolase
MLQSFPSTVAVIDHFCRIGVDGDIREADVEQLCALAKYPQLHIKLSAFYALGRATPPCKNKSVLAAPLYHLRRNSGAIFPHTH